MKYAILGLLAIGLIACNVANDVGETNSGEVAYIERCIDGVVYLVRARSRQGYMSVKFNPDSTVVTCTN